MSEAAKLLFESLKAVKEGVQAVAPGLKDVVAETKAEIARLGTQGGMEAASGLFTGAAFVPYGPGQYTPTPTPTTEHAQSSQERGMER